MFHHFVAVALARQGNMQQAREQWQQALKRSPGFELAQENLDDIKRPIGQRHAPWSFNLGNWVTKQTIDGLVTAVQSTAKSKDELQIAKATVRYLAENPQIATIYLRIVGKVKQSPLGEECVRFRSFQLKHR